ncbi:MAG TPA: phage major capsid protein [Xanthobacteraceae bacterium]|nr:phage major capsid protein [Xanthobacteraceae bacterium]
MTLKEIRDAQAKAVADARTLMESIGSDTTPEKAKEIEEQHDKAMAEYDRLEALAVREQEQIKRENALNAVADPVRTPKGEDRSVPAVEVPEEQPAPLDDVQRKKAFDYYLRYGLTDMPADMRQIMRRAQAEARTFLGQGISTTGGGAAGSDGGYLVPTGFMPELIKSLKAWGPMMDPDIVRVLNTSTGVSIPWPSMDDTSNEGALIAENTAVSTAELTFGTKSLDAWKYTSGVVLVSNELLQDAALDVETIVRDAMAERIGRKGNRDLTTGDGSSKPNGIVHATSGGVTAASASGVTFDDLIELEHSVDPAYRNDPSCRWMFTDTTLKILRKLKDGQGRYIWNPADVKAGEPATISGYAYSVNQHMAEATTGNKSVIFGAFNRYVRRMVLQFSIRRLTERYAEADQIGFIGFTRFDGELLDAGAVKALTQA